MMMQLMLSILSIARVFVSSIVKLGIIETFRRCAFDHEARDPSSADDAVRFGSLQSLRLGQGSHLFGQLELVCFRQDAFPLSLLHSSDDGQSFCFGSSALTNHKVEKRVRIVAKLGGACLDSRHTDQALPKIGLGTHFSDLSNILLNGSEVELEVPDCVGTFARAADAGVDAVLDIVAEAF